MTKKALIITGKLVQDHEFIYPFYRLQEDEYEVKVATPDGNDTTGYYGTRIEVDYQIKGHILPEFDLLILPGGAKCMEYLRQDLGILKFIADFHAKGGVIGSICHGAQLLISAGLVKGKVISGYYSIKDDIVNAGGTYRDEPYITDQRIVTSPHYKYLGLWMKQVLNETDVIRGINQGLKDRSEGKVTPLSELL